MEIIKHMERRLKKQNQLRNVLTKVTFVLVLVIFSLTFSAEAQDVNVRKESKLHKYYTNVEMPYGKSFEEVASQYYCETEYKNVNEFIGEIMEINGIYNTDTIVPGAYFIVPYYSEDIK